MSNVLVFPLSARDRPAVQAGAKMAEIVIFPGIRYERETEAASPKPSDATGTGRKARRK